MFCPKCGSEVTEGSAFCGQCGASIASRSNGNNPGGAPSNTQVTTQIGLSKPVLIVAAIVILFVIVACLVGLTRCVGGSAGDGSKTPSPAQLFEGGWVMNSLEQNGHVYGPDTIDEFIEQTGYTYVQLKEDGSAVMHILGSSMKGTWEVSSAESVSLSLQSGEVFEMVLDGDELVWDDDGLVMRFERGYLPEMS